MLVRNIEVSAGSGPAIVRVGDAVVVLRRVGERFVNIAIDAPKDVRIHIETPDRAGDPRRD